MSRQLAELLLKDKIINPAQFKEAEGSEKTSRGFIRYLIGKKYITETKLLYYLSQKFGLPSINLAKFEINPEIIKRVPIEFVKKNQIIPIQANEGTMVVALCDPSGIQALEGLKFLLKTNVEAVLTSYSAFDSTMDRYYGGAGLVGHAVESFRKEAKSAGEDTMVFEAVQVHAIDEGSVEQDAPVIAAVNGIITEGVRRGASDIHVEPYEKRMRVRMRIDGVLFEVAEIPIEMKRALIARFKILSRMDIAETRIPQDGRIKIKAGLKELDFRVNSVPTLFGEKIVLRALSKGNLQLDLLKLGFEEKQLELFRKGIYSPNGMVLVTGPTGSGKTTTLYSALAELNQISDNLSTAEDPVEYNLEGINQVEVHKDIGLTFANVLRAFLRQDPDVILVGEVRDYETAEVSIQAALTGHLVLSTLHTNDAVSTITRLLNMGVEPFLVVASLNTIVAQRLLRMVCQSCKTDVPMNKAAIMKLGFSESQVDQVKICKGQGCSKCNKSGYKGRIAIYEVLDFTSTLKEMVLRGESVIEMKKVAIKEGMKTLRMSALTKLAQGMTTVDEALSITMEN